MDDITITPGEAAGTIRRVLRSETHLIESHLLRLEGDARRRRFDIIVKFLCLGAAIFGVTWLGLILFTLFYNGLAGLNLAIFTENTPPPGSTDGGLLHAIVGSNANDIENGRSPGSVDDPGR